jgi:hypothetical protein
MDPCVIAQRLAAKNKSTFFTVRIRREAAKRAAFRSENIEKESTFQGMTNIDYANRSPVREAVAAGLRDAPQTPSWVERCEYIEDTRFWIKGDQWYFPMVFIKTLDCCWWRNEQPTEFETVKPMLLASEYAERPTKDEIEDKGQAQFVGIKVQNILELH